MKINHFQKFLIALFSLIFILLGFFFLVTRPLLNKIIKESSEIAKNKKEILSLEKKSQELKAVNEDLKKQEPDFQKLEEVFFKETEALKFITSLEALAKKNDIQLDFEAISLPEAAGLPAVFRLRIRGSFPSVLKYLAHLENLATPTSVFQLSLMNLNQNQPLVPPLIEGIIDLSVFRQ